MNTVELIGRRADAIRADLAEIPKASDEVKDTAEYFCLKMLGRDPHKIKCLVLWEDDDCPESIEGIIKTRKKCLNLTFSPSHSAPDHTSSDNTFRSLIIDCSKFDRLDCIPHLNWLHEVTK